MSTMNDVAKRAGVSTMTVSRVINNAGYISAETRQRVERAIAELDYVPNALARSLRHKQTHTLALILTDITNPFFTTIARGVEDTASQYGFSVIFCNTDESQDKEGEYLNILVQRRVDGILFVPASTSADSITFLQERHTTVVVLDRRLSDMKVDCVRCDAEEGAYQLTQHLLELGHKDIAILSGPQTVSTAIDRVRGYERAFVEAGRKHQPGLYGTFTRHGGYEMAQRALALKPRPTAFVATNNFIAVGAFQAIREAGLRVPEDISLVSFDDLSAALVMEPFLTAVDQPAYEMGQRATALLLSRLSGQTIGAPQEVILPTRLIVRKSSAPPHR